uniref:Integrase catalytic domain-containing protein n=1 Tax=Fagus sylvatica TaxID=28930 RepID=A0A2N9EWZ5_FAGSY
MLQVGYDLPDEGPRTLHASRDPTDSGRPHGRPEGIKCHSLSVLRTVWSGRDRWKSTLKCSPLVAKEVRDLTANLQELTQKNQVLNQKLLQREIERGNEKDKGKSETKGENTRMTVRESTVKWEQEMKAMRAQMGEMKDEFKGRVAKNLDNLVHRTDSPFTKAVTSFPLPSKFRMPSLETFDGSKDPLDHLESFKTMMCLQGVSDEIMCRAFPTTLKGPARIWFKKLTPNSVGSFAQLSRLFFNHFIGGQRFNKEMLLVDGADDKVVLTAFISGLQSGDFLFSVYKDPPNTMTEMMYEAQRHMNGEEALQARDQTSGKKRKWEYADRPTESHETRPKAQKNRNRRQKDRSGRGFNERFNHFTPLNALVDHIFMQIKDDPALKWPGQVVDEPRQKAERQENYRDLLKGVKEKIVPKGPVNNDLQWKHFQEPPLREIHVITGGMAAGGTSHSSQKVYARQIHNVLVTQKTDKKPRLEDLPITFIEEDARKVFHSHDDALVVTLEIAGYSTRRVLIDNGSSANIIYLTAFQQMKIGKDQLRPIETPLVGFAGTSVYPLGVISLQITARYLPETSNQEGRLLSKNGIGEMRGDQAMVRECYLTSISTEQVHQTLIVEERQNIAEPTEELEEIVLIEDNEKKTTRIGTSMTKEIQDSIVRFLRENADVFAWSHDDMLGISTEVIAHKLNVNPSMSPVKQKRRVLAPDRNAVVMEEVDKLLTAGFIREVYYPEWLANVDSYALPRIDQLVDSTTGHKLLSFMDAFSSYNQIQMTEEDQEKMAFITSRGLFCYKTMPFGLKNAGVTYQRLVNKMFHDQIGRNVEVYVDDMLVKSKKDEDHLADLKKTFQALRRYNMKLNPAKCVFGVSSDKFLGFMVSQRGIEANPDKIKAILEMNPPKIVKEVQSLTGKAAALNRFVSRSTDKCLPFFKTLRKAFQWTEECQRAFEELKVYLTSPPLLSPSQTEEELYLYLTISASAVSSALIREEERISPSTTLAMNTPDATGRLVQWSIEMSEFDIDYRPRTVIKAQALANFIAEFTHPWKEDERSEKDEAWTVNIDGSSTKEISGVGVILVSPEKDKFEYALQLRFGATNNEAEYEALLARLKLFKSIGVKSLTLKSDFQLIVGQVKGEYEAKEDRMKKYLMVVKDLLTHFKKVELLQIPRKKICLSPEEANYVIREVHEGVCGNHSGVRALAHKLIRVGYYWLSLLHDATQYVKTCDKCQRFTNVPRVPPEEITPITSPWPFMQWGLDIMGPFPVGTKQAKFLVVAIDYFTKWVEAEPLATISEKNVKSFIWKGVICRFGIPRVLISDNGKQFDNGPFREIVTPTKETPFKLTFDTKAVIPVEIRLTTLRTTFHKEEENEGQLRLNLDLLDETREKAALRITLYQGKMARYYNTKVKLRRFEIGDWVLRKVTQATKESHGKLGPN